MGLGLAIVRRFAALLGHEIALDSREAAGSRYRVLLPRVAMTARQHRVRAPAASPDSPDLHPFAGRLVAVVDDDPATVDAMRTLFETWGASVVGGDTPDTLLAGLGTLERYPDLVVADLRLAADRSGIDAVRRLRDELGYAIPAIIVSGDTGTRADREARAAGLSLLPKPVVGTTLRAAAIALLKARDGAVSRVANAAPASVRGIAPSARAASAARS
jgi:CheY-like chemotaxis protein